MSDDVQDVSTDETEAPEAASDAAAPAEAAVEEPVSETTAEADQGPVAAETVTAEPAKDSASEDSPLAEDAVAEEPAAEEVPAEPDVAEAPAAVSDAFGPVRVARVYVCERGHRTTTLWGEPDVCQARPFRSGPTCGMPLYHITELPDQVQKALNPLKASKKASKKK